MLAYQKDKSFHSLSFFKYSIWHKEWFFKTISNALIFPSKRYPSLESTDFKHSPEPRGLENRDPCLPRRAHSSRLCGEGASWGAGKWDKYKTDPQNQMPFHYHCPMVCLLRYASCRGSYCLGHGEAGFCSHWVTLPRGSLFSLFETGASALHQALLQAGKSSSLALSNRVGLWFSLIVPVVPWQSN